MEPLHAVSQLFRPFLPLSETASKTGETSATCWVFGRSAAESIAWFYTLFRCFDTPPPQLTQTRSTPNPKRGGVVGPRQSNVPTRAVAQTETF